GKPDLRRTLGAGPASDQAPPVYRRPRPPGNSRPGRARRGSARVRVSGPRVTAVQRRTRGGNRKAFPAAIGPEVTTGGASVSSDRSVQGVNEARRGVRDRLTRPRGRTGRTMVDGQPRAKQT